MYLCVACCHPAMSCVVPRCNSVLSPKPATLSLICLTTATPPRFQLFFLHSKFISHAQNQSERTDQETRDNKVSGYKGRFLQCYFVSSKQLVLSDRQEKRNMIPYAALRHLNVNLLNLRATCWKMILIIIQ